MGGSTIINRSTFATAILFAAILACNGSAAALMIVPGDIAGFTAASAQIVRGKCLRAVPGFADVGGARLSVTTYRFRVVDGLKGAKTGRLEFRQVGSAGGGARDLGRMAGLPVYSPGTEYLLFLLPASAAGLTSPAGAAQGAFEVAGDVVTPLVATATEAKAEGSGSALRAGDDAQRAGGKQLSYRELRRQVLELLAAGSATRP